MKDIWNLQPGTCIVVDANQYGQPIGKETSKLAKFLDTIARTGSICPLNTKHWKHLSKYVLENILKIVPAKKEGREPLRLEQFRFQHFRKDGSDKLSSEAIEQVYVRNKWVSEREACLIVEAEERFMKLTEIREAKFMDMMDAREKKHRALFNECMAKGMSIEFQSSGFDDKAFSSDDEE
ncbi:hypothetical protein Goshw_015006 [Gossypium schwendimanii]|uniref:Uncharacterized protein n=1 Tax=Gossypium schwendimanii TaxID=34291 RepID=A0A7J9MC22_GOSSC|nr:hypothetical protein [Gossypium schwendimanii]